MNYNRLREKRQHPKTHGRVTISIDITFHLVLYFGILMKATQTMIIFRFPTRISTDENPKPASKPHL